MSTDSDMDEDEESEGGCFSGICENCENECTDCRYVTARGDDEEKVLCSSCYGFCDQCCEDRPDVTFLCNECDSFCSACVDTDWCDTCFSSVRSEELYRENVCVYCVRKLCFVSRGNIFVCAGNEWQAVTTTKEFISAFSRGVRFRKRDVVHEKNKFIFIDRLNVDKVLKEDDQTVRLPYDAGFWHGPGDIEYVREDGPLAGDEELGEQSFLHRFDVDLVEDDATRVLWKGRFAVIARLRKVLAAATIVRSFIRHSPKMERAIEKANFPNAAKLAEEYESFW